jgi:hypothetical protein
MTSRLFTVAFLRSTMTAASTTSATVVAMGGMWNAFLNAELTELLTTWLIPHQQMRPDSANSTATTDRRSGFFRFRSAHTWI